MKKITNLSFAAFVLAIILIVNLACSSLSTSKSAENTAKPNNSATETPTGTAPEIEKADFTMTSEEYDKEFTKKGVTDADLEKYKNKNIRVTGRVSLLSLEKKGTTDPWVTLFAPGLGHGVSCYFDDDNLNQMKSLKMDKVVTIQGFQDDFLVPEVSPRIEHCVVVKAD